MDNFIAESKDVEIPELNFGLPQNIRFYISGDANQYLDLSSVRLFATLENRNLTRAKFLKPLGGLHAFFNRCRARVLGQMVQDIVEYNRHCELFKSFKSKDVNEMDNIESSANPSWDGNYHRYATGLNNMIDYTTSGATNAGGAATVNTLGDHNEYGRIHMKPTKYTVSGIPGNNGKVKLGHKPCCGLLESNYYLPLRVAPLELEFTVVSDGNKPIIVLAGDVTANPETETNKQGYFFQAGNTATGDDWVITGVYLRCETVSLDNSMDNSITSALLSGTSLKMVIPQYHTITQTFNTGGGEINMNMVKSASKLSHVFITLYRQPRGGNRYGYYTPDNYLHKRWNFFYYTMINGEFNDGPAAASVPLQQGKGFADSTRALSWQIANKKYPEFEAQSLSEAWYFLRRIVNLMNPEQNSLNISYKQYRENKFVIGISFEKMASVNFTSINTKMGSLITFKLKGTEGALLETEQIQENFCQLVSETILELRSDGAIVYD